MEDSQNITPTKPMESSEQHLDSAQTQLVGASIIQSFSGPLPPPELLEHYEKVFPGAAKRIFDLVESQSKHRMEVEKQVISSDVFDAKLGMILGFLIAIGAIGASVWFVNKGQTVAGIAGLITTIGALVYSFRYDANKAEADKDQKNEDLKKDLN